MKTSSRKVLSALLALVMVVSMLSMSALAVESSYSLTPYDSNVTALTLSGVNVNSYTVVSEPLSEGSSNTRMTYNIVLSADTASNATVTINFTAPSGNVVSPVPPNGQPGYWIPIINGNASNTYTVTLADGVATRTVYVHKNFPTTYQNCDIYIFNFTVGTYLNPVTTADSEQIGNMGAVDVTGIDSDSVVVEATGATYVYINGVNSTSQTIDLSDGEVHYSHIRR